jgi:hypothetical protein
MYIYLERTRPCFRNRGLRVYKDKTRAGPSDMTSIPFESPVAKVSSSPQNRVVMWCKQSDALRAPIAGIVLGEIP